MLYYYKKIFLKIRRKIMNFNELEYIRTIASEQSISKASQKLGISQPALSRCLINLERNLNVKLFEKINSKYISTAAGQLYLEFADNVLRRKDVFDSELRDLIKFDSGKISFGITPGRSKSLTPIVLPEFQKHFPNIKIQLFEENVEVLENMLNKGLLDVAYFTVDPKVFKENQKIRFEFLHKEEIILTVKKGTHLLQPAQLKYGFSYPWIDIGQFANRKFLSLKKNTRLGQVIPHILQENKINPSIVELTNIYTALELAMNGYGICLCSSLRIYDYNNVLDIYSFGLDPIHWNSVAAYRVGSHMTEPLCFLTELYRAASNNCLSRSFQSDLS